MGCVVWVEGSVWDGEGMWCGWRVVYGVVRTSVKTLDL